MFAVQHAVDFLTAFDHVTPAEGSKGFRYNESIPQMGYSLRNESCRVQGQVTEQHRRHLIFQDRRIFDSVDQISSEQL